VEGPCDDVLARAALAGDQDRRRRVRDPTDHRDDFLQGLARADQPSDARFRVRRSSQLVVLLGDRPHLGDPLEAELQPRRLDRLGQEIEGADAKRGDGAVEVLIRRDDDDRRLGAPLAKAPDQLESVDSRELEVDQVGVEFVGRRDLERRLGVADGDRMVTVPYEGGGEPLANELVVIDDEDVSGSSRQGGAPEKRVMSRCASDSPW